MVLIRIFDRLVFSRDKIHCLNPIKYNIKKISFRAHLALKQG